MKNRFVSIWLPYLLTDYFSLKNAGLRTVSFVVTKPVKGRVIIVAVNKVAEGKGIYPGMVLADARTIDPALQMKDEKEGMEYKILRRLAEWCIRFSPVAAVDSPGGVLIDASGCTQLWGTDEKYVTDITHRIQAHGFFAKVAIADTIGAAWSIARFSNTRVVESNKHIHAICSLPPECLRIESETTERLHKLGLHEVNDLLSIPPSALRRRFGPALLQRINQAVGIGEEYLQPVFPPQPFVDRLPCPEPIVTRPGIEIALEQLLATVCQQLIAEGRGARELFFKCLRVDNKMLAISIATHAPSVNARHLFKLFSIKLDTLEPGLGIELFILEASKTDEHKPKQEKLWNQAAGFNDHRIAELIDRIAGRIGDASVSRYLPAEHYWPEHALKRSGSLNQIPESRWRTDKMRPVRLLKKPEPIEVTAPIPDYPPMMFRYRQQLHKVMRADGPERIEQEWWRQDGQHRDYYAVQDENGNRYWLFRSGHYDAEKTYSWFIHGFFA